MSAAGWRPQTPLLTVDVLVHLPGRGIVLVERKNPPHGWALPGGFVDLGESCEAAAVREMREETGLEVELTSLLGVYSDPARDPRGHTASAVYTAQALNPDQLQAGDDAAKAQVFPLNSLPPLAFDHGRIVRDYVTRLSSLRPPGGDPAA
ncbi:MAG: NUDIX hydrolase [Humidesulfovibrio sp.]|uniref:NUDIX hydrolase n=1 Tax=Humidesulfovibrio sp. TaxID=2910988 RepID=UPI0027E6BE00|nr:NUDIX hydrolase [Humidesulfovibrio sp.]MDQ7835166.1 NUDIX hydrolase [Humidesulfovibrio sp.]